MSRTPRRRSQHTEFQHPIDGADWRIEDWTSLKNTFEIEKPQLGDFAKVATIHETPWLMARMRFGINPVVPPLNTDPDYLRAFTTAEVAEHFQTDEEQVTVQLEILQDAWHRFLKEGPDEPEPPKAAEPIPAPPDAAKSAEAAPPEPAKVAEPSKLPVVPRAIFEVPVADFPDPPHEYKELLHRFGFTMQTFNVPGRLEALRMHEIFWFCGRIMELQRMFEEPMAKNLARMAVMNEIQLRRADDEISTTHITANRYWDIQQTKLKIEEIYQKQWSKLEEICPYIKASAVKAQVTGVVSELIKAHQNYCVSGDTILIDGLLTSFEIQVAMRSSIQQGPQYRPGWVMAVREAREHINDPMYKRKLPDKHFKLLDEAFREAYQRMVDAGEIVPIDLEDKGPKGEYPPLIAPAPEEVEDVIPDVDIPLEISDAK